MPANTTTADADPDEPTEIPVLIVGGGPVGLITSILLSHHGIRSLLVEQHPGTSIYPKARFVNARTMEILRQIGIEQAVREVAIPHTRNVLWVRSLAGEEIARRPVETMIPETVRDWSPSWGCTSTQEIFEPILLAQARLRQPAQVRLSTQLLNFEQHDESVVATLVHRLSGQARQVRVQYLIGADGAHSQVRESLGIHMQGEAVLTHSVNILFRADLSQWVGDREINLCFIANPEAAGLLLHNGGDRWRFTASYFPGKGERPEDFTAERCLQVIRTAIGVPELSLELGETFPWSDAALVAERFGDRHVFLAGDAEHLMPPAGGFGMSVGIQDAHNLAWKLAAALKGWAGPVLLASYESERAPISRQITEQMMRNAFAAQGTSRGGSEAAGAGPTAASPLSRPEFFREHGLVFGATYHSAMIVPDATAPVQVANPVTDYVPNARPGGRAPHVWLERHGAKISTLDLFGQDWVVLAGDRGQPWCQAANEVARRLGVPIQTFRVGREAEVLDPDKVWANAYGLDSDGAVLVRPDGYVAWRCATSKPGPTAEIETALRTALGRQ